MSKTNQKQREEFRTRLGFIVACIGSAVGMGNIWMFPTAPANSEALHF